jgi:hypothetical protein
VILQNVVICLGEKKTCNLKNHILLKLSFFVLRSHPGFASWYPTPIRMLILNILFHLCKPCSGDGCNVILEF